MNRNPLISVVIPTYNRAHLVCNAVESVLGQTYSPVEIIVVDDGSTDDTQKRLARYDGRIQVVRKQNAGPSAARNTGVSSSRGEYLAFLDSDDLCLPNRLVAQVEAMCKAGPSVPCCLCNVLLLALSGGTVRSFDSAWIRPSLREGIWLNPLEVLTTRFAMFNQGALLRREAFARVGGFDGSLRYLEDYDLAIRLAFIGPWAIISDPLAVWRESPDSLSRGAPSRGVTIKECELAIRQRLSSQYERLENHLSVKRLAKYSMERNRCELAIAKFNSGWPVAAQTLGRLARAVLWTTESIVERLPWYPRACVAPWGSLSGPA